MPNDFAYHFISGLPRSGSTLLAAILRQNPAVHANISSPVGAMVNTILGDMSAGNESAIFFNQAQREAVLRGLFTNYYDALEPGRAVFDTKSRLAGADRYAGDALPAVQDDLLRTAHPLDSRQRRAIDPEKHLRILEDLQLRRGWNRLFPRRWADEPGRHGRVSAGFAEAGDAWRAGASHSAVALRSAGGPASRGDGGGLCLHRRRTVHARFRERRIRNEGIRRAARNAGPA